MRHALLAIPLLLATAPAAAQKDWSRELVACLASASWEGSARACHAVIEAGKEQPAHLALAYVQRAGRRVETGSDGSVRVTSSENGAIADFTEAIRLDPTLVAAFGARAIAWHRRGEFDRALADSDEAIRLRERDINPNTLPQLHHLLMRRGDIWRDKGVLDRALADFDAALAAKPDAFNRWLATLNRGMTLQMMRAFDRALADFNTLVEDGQNPSRAYAARGLVHLQMSNARAASEDFNAALARAEYRSTLALAFYGRALAREQSGDDAGARADRGAATALDEPLVRHLRSIGKGLLRSEAAGARAEFDAVIARSPNTIALALALHGRGLLRLRTGDSTGGKADLAAAAVLDPHVVEDIARLGLK